MYCDPVVEAMVLTLPPRVNRAYFFSDTRSMLVSTVKNRRLAATGVLMRRLIFQHIRFDE